MEVVTVESGDYNNAMHRMVDDGLSIKKGKRTAGEEGAKEPKKRCLVEEVEQAVESPKASTQEGRPSTPIVVLEQTTTKKYWKRTCLKARQEATHLEDAFHRRDVVRELDETKQRADEALWVARQNWLTLLQRDEWIANLGESLVVQEKQADKEALKHLINVAKKEIPVRMEREHDEEYCKGRAMKQKDQSLAAHQQEHFYLAIEALAQRYKCTDRAKLECALTYMRANKTTFDKVLEWCDKMDAPESGKDVREAIESLLLEEAERLLSIKAGSKRHYGKALLEFLQRILKTEEKECADWLDVIKARITRQAKRRVYDEDVESDQEESDQEEQDKNVVSEKEKVVDDEDSDDDDEMYDANNDYDEHDEEVQEHIDFVVKLLSIAMYEHKDRDSKDVRKYNRFELNEKVRLLEWIRFRPESFVASEEELEHLEDE